MTTLLDVRDVGKTFTSGGFRSPKRTVALANASLTLDEDRPSVTTIAGESGSGKTTLARLILGIIQPSNGQILYRGRDVSQMTGAERKVFRREVQAVFQDPFSVYNPFYKASHTLDLCVEKFHLARSKSEAQALKENAVEAVGLRPEETLDRYPHQLSGGQRQRIMVARALLLRPKIIVADEPVSMVDASLRATILESFLKIHREFGISLIYITHDLTTAYQISQNILMLYQGTVVEVGRVDNVILNPQHPYSQLLVGSIPLPDPKLRKNRERLRFTADELAPVQTHGCCFAPRCPHAMPKCLQIAPPLFQTEEGRATACYLYENAHAITSADMARVLEVQ
jgi:oligopeptide/dipeptide ABC transporter ATP-binding protein